jgi:hypothetical protein
MPEKNKARGEPPAAVARARWEVADIFRGRGSAWRKANTAHVSLGQLKVHVGDRELSQGGPRRTCRALRDVPARRD